MVLTYRGSGVVNSRPVQWDDGHVRLLGALRCAALADASGDGHRGRSLGIPRYLCHLLMSHLRQASNLTRIVVTLAMLVALEGLVGLKYPVSDTYTVTNFLPNGEGRSSRPTSRSPVSF